MESLAETLKRLGLTCMKAERESQAAYAKLLDIQKWIPRTESERENGKQQKDDAQEESQEKRT